ncbi:MAG: DUF1761 domain-containing protein [Xanthomonadales bacterium]|nr:DUF1761 domain-containing protein [Xanthomonadales bacterium]
MSIWLIRAAAVSTFVLGFLWYAPFAFLKPWLRENGLPEDFQAGHPAQVFGISFIFAVLAAGAYVHLVGFSDDVGAAALEGAAVGAGFAATSFGINYQFAGRSLKLWLIDGGYHTVQFAIFGIIFAAFH